MSSALAGASLAPAKLEPLEQTLARQREELNREPSAARYQAYLSTLLSAGLASRAEPVLEAALRRYPAEPELLEQMAALRALEGKPFEARSWLEKAWAAGADPLAWLRRGVFVERLAQEPYRSLVRPERLLDGLERLRPEAQAERLGWLRFSAEPLSAARIVSVLEQTSDAAVLTAGLDALRGLGSEAVPYIARLLEARHSRARREALLEIWRTRAPGYRPFLERELAEGRETDRGNLDLARVLLAVLASAGRPLPEAEAVLAAIPSDNSFRRLALHERANLFFQAGFTSRAEQLRAEAEAETPPALEPPRAYWECQDRTDLRAMRELTELHQRSRIDARVYGLPRDDFDDHRNLSIAERLFLRSYAKLQGWDWPTSGPIQYPREIGHLLERLERESGARVDCSGRLAQTSSPSPLVVGEDGAEVKLHEDTELDNEVHISVDPFDQRYLVATSNNYGSGSGNKSFRSSDWGKTWITSFIPIAGNCCDPVSYYTQALIGGNWTDVIYHATLTTTKAQLLYSTDQGANWTTCPSPVNASGSPDRQDFAIDTNQASPCFDTIYVGYHKNGAQYMGSSTGTSFPYCQSWNERAAGVNSTLGSAIVVSTNGVAHNIFTQYGTPGGVYHAMTQNCGSSWAASTKLFSIQQPGTFEWGIPSTCLRQIYYYPQADSDRQAQSAYVNNIYVVWNDLSGSCTAPGCNGNTTCNNDVYFGVGVPDNRQNPTSWTWTSRNLTASLSDLYTDEFYPSITVDQADGAVYVTYYRADSGSGGNLDARRRNVHQALLKSIDGGATWDGPYQVTDQPTDESAGSGAFEGMQWGDYAWNDVINGVAYPVWIDRREDADEDVWTSKVCSPPAHWSERAPGFTVPGVSAFPQGGNLYSVDWPLPDLYWGDGGESPAQRKFQLYVDDVLAQDNIAASTSHVDWTAPDGLSHSLKIRAVNQCGLSKDYQPVTVPSGATTPTPTPTWQFSPTPTSTLAVTFTATPTQPAASTPTATGAATTPSATPTSSPVASGTPTAKPSSTPAPPTSTPTAEPSSSPTASATANTTSTATPSSTPPAPVLSTLPGRGAGAWGLVCLCLALGWIFRNRNPWTPRSPSSRCSSGPSAL